MPIKVNIEFKTEAPRFFLVHKGEFVSFNSSGKGSFTAQDNEWDLILFGIEGAPGESAEIKLSVPAQVKLEIAGHPIKGRIAQGKIVWGDSRFFRVRSEK